MNKYAKLPINERRMDMIKSKKIGFFRTANLYADTMPDGTKRFRLMDRGKLVATDVTPKYLRQIMYQVA